ncbi:MAG TPA: hypothetical protein VE338_10065 [Ktedonobacterales bacterium]|jgi:hypothetical protein|nr:hypothetical protein [Ktedonobacterales bacterium]
MSASSHPVRRPDVETYVLPDGTSLLFDPASESGLPLDTLSSLIWDYCDGALSDDDIAQEIAALLPQITDARAHALTVIEGFKQYGLLLHSTRTLNAT